MLIKPPSRADLHTAYTFAGCPVCGLLSRSERRYIDATLYEHVTDVKWRAEVRAARGFCALHTQHVVEIGRSALGVSLVAGDILKTLREALPTAGGVSGTMGKIRAALGNNAVVNALRRQQPCPICAYLAEFSTVYIGAILDDVATSDGQVAYARSAGLCLPHLLAAAQQGGSGLAALLQHQARIWQQLEGELAEFARKSDYRYSGEPMTDPERDAWRRALLLLGGEQ